MLCPAEEQADTIDKFGPLKPYLIAMFPDAIFIIEPGTKNGEILLGPFSVRIMAFSSMVESPPIPELTDTPIFSNSYESKKPESLMASIAAAVPY